MGTPQYIKKKRPYCHPSIAALLREVLFKKRVKMIREYNVEIFVDSTQSDGPPRMTSQIIALAATVVCYICTVTI